MILPEWEAIQGFAARPSEPDIRSGSHSRAHASHGATLSLMRFSFLLSGLVLLGIAATTFAPTRALADPAAPDDPDAVGPRAARAPTKPERPAEHEPVSVGRRTAGQVLTIVGLVHVAVGVSALSVAGYYVNRAPDDPVTGWGSCDMIGDDLMGCPINTWVATGFVGIPSLVLGTTLTAIGIPLWVTGARAREPESVGLVMTGTGAKLVGRF